ncbi:hypothetical protein ACHHYP_10001 [Achlya hypogyna]|uniref:Uncharacterized protein n=1 Tax=Achlya hypogyna TaxID=1202772 RepID=A0A1V9YLZ7_ACHHY|nr:hypothetical protein ACHHYP_10001 [Achlya hypogyna]
MRARWSVMRIMPILYENIALTGRSGICVRALFDDFEPTKDTAVREACWAILRHGRHQHLPMRYYHVEHAETITPVKPEHTEPAPKKRKAVKIPAKPKAKKKRRKANDSGSESPWNDSGGESDVPFTTVAGPVAKKPTPSRPSVQKPTPCDTTHEVDARSISFANAYIDPSLYVVADEAFRLKVLGVSAEEGDINPTHWDILELVGQRREAGITIPDLASILFNGDVKRIHHFIDSLISRKLCVKRIISVTSKRFNMIHLARFAAHFHPNMVAPGAFFEDEYMNKAAIVTRIHTSMTAHKEATAVFADVAKRFGWSKRLQETIRNYIAQETNRDPAYHVQLFMATCRSGYRSMGRKLWCLKLVEANPTASVEGFRLSHPTRCEMGPLEYIYRLIEAAPEGLTIPQVRDMCGMPDKTCYKKIQALLVSYDLETEKLLMGRSTLYRFRVRGADNKPTLALVKPEATAEAKEDAVYRPSLRTAIEEAGLQPVANVMDMRTEFALESVKQKQVLALATFRRMLVLREHRGATKSRSFTDHRTITKIFQRLVKANEVVFIDVLVPSSDPRHMRKVRCVALPSAVAEPDQPAIKRFIDEFTHEDLSDLGLLYSDPSFKIVVRDPAAATKTPLAKTVLYSRQPVVVPERSSVLIGQQNRRLGMAFGLACRTKLLHLALCEILQARGLWDASSASITFSLQHVLPHLRLHDFVHIFGCQDRLSPAEEAEMAAVLKKERADWSSLSSAVRDKVVKNKWRRVRRLMDNLRDLELVVQEDAVASASVVPTVFDDVDDMVLRAAEDTVTGGTFILNRASIAIPIVEEADKSARVAVRDVASYVRPVTFFRHKRMADNKLPVVHTFATLTDVRHYWDVIEAISVERTRFELVGDNGVPAPHYVAPIMFVSSSSYVRHAWIDLVSSRAQVKKKSTMAARLKIHQRHSYNVLAYQPRVARKVKKQKVALEPIRIKMRYPLVEAAEERALQLYFQELPGTWAIQVPPELRLPNEEKAIFRNPRLGRAKVNYTAISAEIGHVKPMNLKRRIHELLKDPVQRKRRRELEAEMLARKNPSGLFLEEAAVRSSPRLYSCFTRAIQMMVEPDDEYEPRVADALFASWSTTELQMVWRYLYFSHMLAKTTVKDLGHRRGFSLAPITFDFLRLAPTLHPLTMFTEAANVAASFSNLDDLEVAVPENTGSGTMAVLLAGAVQGNLALVPILDDPRALEVFDAPRKKGHAKYVDGVAGHLVRFTQGRPDLIDSKWTVSARPLDADEDDEEDEDAAAESDDDGKAPWTCHCLHRHASMAVCATQLETKLLRAITDAGETGVADSELAKRHRQYSPHQVLERVQALVAASKVVEAHSFADVRYVAAAVADLWQLRAYNFRDGNVEFDASRVAVSRPWLKLDGEVNKKFLLVLKREVAMMVWRYPGMCERDIQAQFRGLLGLQDARCLCFMLVDDGVLYCQALSKVPPASLFSQSTTPTLVPGEYHMDRAEFTLRFFPTTACMENLGLIVDDLLLS